MTRLSLKNVYLALFIVAFTYVAPALAQEPKWKHATALTGEPKYQEGFTQFDYVNINAPKGGKVRLATTGGFDTFNHLPQEGNLADGIGLIYDTLMTSSLDEINISAEYGLIAEAMRYPEDFSWVEFRLNPNATWQDGKKITVEDVIWSFNTAIELSPSQKFYYANVEKGEKTGEHTVKFTFDTANNRELPHIMGQLLVLPQHWWEGTDAEGNPRDISKSTLEPPLGSSAYRIKEFEANREITYERVDDYWAKNHPTQIGKYNFDEIRYISFLDDAVQLEAFKGDQYDFRAERSSSGWCKKYDFEAVNDGRVIKEVYPDKSSGVMQAYVLNLRNEKFSDQRLRQALNLAYDFETTNEVVSCNLLKRIDSYFAGTELASSGLPTGLELEILEEIRDLVPPEVFTTEYKNPVNGSPENIRKNLREAINLLREAGYNLEDGKLIDPATGEQVRIEFIYNDKGSERSLVPYQKSLEKIGIAADLRLIDVPQYINRIRERDFEVATLLWGQSLSPGNEQRNYWGSESADEPQSRNYAGIKNPALDHLIEKIIFAETREELVATTRAMDRVLLWNHYLVPQFYTGEDRYARWDRFSHPENLPEFSFGFPTIWWWDEAKAEQTGSK